MKDKESVKLGYSEYITTKEDAKLIKNVVLPKLNQKRSVNVFCSFSYFTSNYTGIFLMNELSNLIKQGCTVYLVMWDINCECHPYFAKLLKTLNKTGEQLLKEKMEEILQIFKQFKTPMSRLHFYRASDVMNRFVRKQNPNLFMQFYGTMERLDLNVLLHKHKASHLIQMPLDVFFARFLHELYPEDIKDKVETILCYGYQEAIFRAVQNVMLGSDVVNNFNPLLLVLPPHPYLISNNAIPEWSMSKEVMVQQILACKPSAEDIQQMYLVILRKFLTEFELLGKNDEITLLPFEEFVKKNAIQTLETQQVSLAYNLYNYLAKVRQGVESTPVQRTKHLANGFETSAYAKLLSKKRILDILRTIDGTQNSTQIAKRLKIARSNMSTYLKLLEKHDLICVSDDGVIQKKIAAVTMNFDVAMH